MFQKPKPIKCGPYTLVFERTLIMGILNVTPDSFSDGGLYNDAVKAVLHAKKMVENGADIIDVGGESTRPGSEPVTAEEELERVEPIIKKMVKEINIPISIDTYKPEVAERCIELGVHMVNDITGLRNKEMIKIAKKRRIPVVMMHMKGMPKTMQENPVYGDVVAEIKGFFRDRVKEAEAAGVKDIIIDPGIGFGKTAWHNLQILKRLDEFKEHDCPIMVGPSRKSFTGNITGLPANERLEGTIAAVAIAVMNGANIVRVHNVRECKHALKIVDAALHA